MNEWELILIPLLKKKTDMAYPFRPFILVTGVKHHLVNFEFYNTLNVPLFFRGSSISDIIISKAKLLKMFLIKIPPFLKEHTVIA